MLKITRERKKYRVKSPYDEADKKAIQERQAKELKRKKEEERRQQNEKNTQNSLENRIVNMCKLLANNEEQIQKYEEVNTKMEHIKEKSFRRKTKKKLTNTINKNKLKQKLIKKDIIWKTEKVLSQLKEKKNRDLKKKNKKNNNSNHNYMDHPDLKENEKLILAKMCQQKEIEGFQNEKQLKQDKQITKNKRVETPLRESGKNLKKRIAIDTYDKVINSEAFLQDPLQYIKQNLKK